MKLKKLSIILVILIFGIAAYIAITRYGTEIRQNNNAVEKNNARDDSINYSGFSNTPIEKEENKQISIPRKIGETCGESIGQCEQGLKCAYPCGIQGCENVCLAENELPRP